MLVAVKGNTFGGNNTIFLKFSIVKQEEFLGKMPVCLCFKRNNWGLRDFCAAGGGGTVGKLR